MQITATKAQLKHVYDLKQKKVRLESRHFVVEGVRLCEEALKSNWSLVHFYFRHDFIHSDSGLEMMRGVESREIPFSVVKAPEFNKISSTQSGQGVLCVARFPLSQNFDFEVASSNTIMLGIETLTDPGNFGTIIRTAAWFGIETILAGPETVAWHNEKVVRASMGGIFHINLISTEDFTASLSLAKRAGFEVVAADHRGEIELSDFSAPSKCILLLGDETRGFSESSQTLIDKMVRIQGDAKVESLNVASAAAILCAHLKRL